MAWSPVPDFASPGRPARAALAMTAIIMLVQSWRGYTPAVESLGDTDDALRLGIVRELLAGHNWFDTHLDRLQPPAGVDIHWSRLIDGGMAALNKLFGLVLPPEAAELAMRLIWPLLWVFPLMLGALLVARRLGGSVAVLACAILAASYPVQMQFAAGRIDHHNVQIALSMLMLAGAVSLDTKWGPWLAGISTGLALAVGLEPLLFAALFGIAAASRFVADPLSASAIRRYCGGLGGTVALAFLVQTPPHLWLVPACDMLAINLVAGLVAASIGLFAATFVTRSPGVRLACVVVAGTGALAIYLSLDPNCIAGPYAGMDARLHAEWLDHVTEFLSWPELFRRNPALAAALLAPAALALVALFWCARDKKIRRDPAWLVSGALLLVALVCGVAVVRMLPYAAAFAAVVLAGAFAKLAPGKIRQVFVAAALAAFALSLTPVALAGVILVLESETTREASKQNACTKTASFAALGEIPPGLFLADIDIGPHLIVHTGHRALAAPYHRMNEGLATAHEIWSLPPAEAATRLRQRGIGYVMLCPSRGALPIVFPESSLRAALERGNAPDFLEAVPAGDAFKVWRVKP